jgi:hypothetical protein
MRMTMRNDPTKWPEWMREVEDTTSGIVIGTSIDPAKGDVGEPVEALLNIGDVLADADMVRVSDVGDESITRALKEMGDALVNVVVERPEDMR